MPDGTPLSTTLFTTTWEELQLAPAIGEKLIPEHLRATIALPTAPSDAPGAHSNEGEV